MQRSKQVCWEKLQIWFSLTSAQTHVRPACQFYSFDQRYLKLILSCSRATLVLVRQSVMVGQIQHLDSLPTGVRVVKNIPCLNSLLILIPSPTSLTPFPYPKYNTHAPIPNPLPPSPERWKA